jgi:hypothetical protein
MAMRPKKMGRPPEGLGKGAEPEKIADYPRLSLTVRPITKAKLEAVTTLEGRPAWRIVEDSINLYVERMPAEDRRAVEAIAKRSTARLAPEGGQTE